MGTPSNNPPAPVSEALTVPSPDAQECTQLKEKFDIKTRQHRKGAPKASGNESHHILQDKAMEGIVSTYSGFAVLLDGASGGAHDVVNKSQTERNCHDGLEGQGPSTFGGLQQTARDDLKKGIQKKASDEGKPMTDTEAETLSNCLVVEAVKHTEKYVKKKGRPPLTKDTPVSPVKGCFVLGTLVWLDERHRVPVESITRGTAVQARSGRRVVTRIDGCQAAVVRILLPHGELAIASYHELRLRCGRAIRSDALRAGHELQTHFGPQVVLAVFPEPARRPLVNLGFDVPDACRVGESGVWAAVSDLGPVQREPVPVLSFSSVSAWSCLA